MRWLRLNQVKWWSSTAAAAGLEQQKYRRKVVEAAHQQQQQAAEEPAEQEHQDPENDIERKADAVCDQFLKQSACGVGFAVAVSVDGDMKYRKAFGLKDLENRVKADVEDFTAQVWSCTKPFTAHCWAKSCNDEETIDAFTVDEILSDYPKEIYIRRTNERHEIDQYRKKTLEDEIYPSNLLTHTAGVANNGLDFFMNVDTTDSTKYRSAAAFLRKYGAVCQLFTAEPMRESDYSNFGYDLIAVMLELMENKNFRDYSLEQLTSLRMMDTDHHSLDEIYMSEAVKGYDYRETEEDNGSKGSSLVLGEGSNLTVRYGSASLISNVDDLNKFGNITARMYKRAYIDGPSGTVNDFPLNVETIVSQHGALYPYQFDYEIGEWEDQSAGWEVHRRLESNVRNKRRVNVRIGHNGLGTGFSAQLSIGFHRLKVPEKLEKANPTPEDRTEFALKTRQFDPEHFNSTTIPMDQGAERLVLDSEWRTRWDLPADLQVLFIDWDEYGDHFVEISVAEAKDRYARYYHSACMYLFLMATARNLQHRVRYHERLAQLLNTFVALDETDKLLRHLMRKQILEHRRVCRNADGSLSREDMEKFERICDAFEREHSVRIAAYFARMRGTLIHYVGPARDEIMSAQGLVMLNDPRFRYTASLQLQRMRRHVNSFDLNMPFNLSQDVWNTLVNQFHLIDPRNKRSFDNIDLDVDACSCSKYARLTRRYGSHRRQHGYQHFYNANNVLEPDTDEEEPPEIPLSWERPDDGAAGGSEKRSAHKARKLGDGEEEEEKCRWVVVSIITNTRPVDVVALEHELNEIFGQHYNS